METLDGNIEIEKLIAEKDNWKKACILLSEALEFLREKNEVDANSKINQAIEIIKNIQK